MKVKFIYRFVWFIKTTRVPWERVLRNKRWPLLPERSASNTSQRLAACASRSSVRQPRGCHRCWNETLLALHFDASPRQRSGRVESIGDCLQRFPFAPRMRSGAWMLDTFMRIAPMKSLLDRGLSQAGVLDRRLSPDTWATCWSDGTFGTCRHPTRDSASLHPCRQAAYFLPCTRPPDACGSCLDRPRHRRTQGNRDRTQVRAFVITRAGNSTGGPPHLCSRPSRHLL
jgi:hypothetical protein